jgi:hypothetical protein
LLDAGAEVDATADVYGGGATTLGLAATSAHPRRAGVQIDLIQILIDHGAQIERPHASGGGGHGAVMGCLANGCPEAAEYLAQRGARMDIVGAAALGRLEVVLSYFDKAGARKPGVTQDQVQEGFQYACRYGHNDVAEFLLQRGADLAGSGDDGQTGLHWAVIFARLDTVKMLLRHNPPLEARNMYGGTVLGQALWSAAHGGDPEFYIAILEELVAAGAKLRDRHPPVNPRVDVWLAKRGNVADPTWYWYGERPSTAKG